MPDCPCPPVASMARPTLDFTLASVADTPNPVSVGWQSDTISSIYSRCRWGLGLWEVAYSTYIWKTSFPSIDSVKPPRWGAGLRNLPFPSHVVYLIDDHDDKAKGTGERQAEARQRTFNNLSNIETINTQRLFTETKRNFIYVKRGQSSM